MYFLMYITYLVIIIVVLQKSEILTVNVLTMLSKRGLEKKH